MHKSPSSSPRKPIVDRQADVTTEGKAANQQQRPSFRRSSSVVVDGLEIDVSNLSLTRSDDDPHSKYPTDRIRNSFTSSRRSSSQSTFTTASISTTSGRVTPSIGSSYPSFSDIDDDDDDLNVDALFEKCQEKKNILHGQDNSQQKSRAEQTQSTMTYDLQGPAQHPSARRKSVNDLSTNAHSNDKFSKDGFRRNSTNTYCLPREDIAKGNTNSLSSLKEGLKTDKEHYRFHKPIMRPPPPMSYRINTDYIALRHLEEEADPEEAIGLTYGPHPLQEDYVQADCDPHRCPSSPVPSPRRVVRSYSHNTGRGHGELSHFVQDDQRKHLVRSFSMNPAIGGRSDSKQSKLSPNSFSHKTIAQFPSRMTPRSNSMDPIRQPTSSGNKKAVEERPLVEVTPGTFVPLRGNVETYEAIRTQRTVSIPCQQCSIQLICVEDVNMVMCPTCRSISPIRRKRGSRRHRSGNDAGGLALGVKEDDVLSEMVSKN